MVLAAVAAFAVFSAVTAFAQQGAPDRGGQTPAAAGAPGAAGRGGRGGGRGGNALPTLPPGKLYNTAKEKLLAGQQVFSFTQSTMDPAGYCEKAKHYDYTWFEMQHSTLEFKDIEAMIAACEGYSGCIGVALNGVQAASRSVASLPSMSPLRMAVIGRQKP